MALHLSDNLLLQDLSLEPAQRVVQGFALLKLHFSHTKYTSQLDQNSGALSANREKSA
jgi:hypothetical protein